MNPPPALGAVLPFGSCQAGARQAMRCMDMFMPAGASHGQEVTPSRMEGLIRAAGRVPKQRSTLYGTPPANQTERYVGLSQLCLGYATQQSDMAALRLCQPLRLLRAWDLCVRWCLLTGRLVSGRPCNPSEHRRACEGYITSELCDLWLLCGAWVDAYLLGCCKADAKFANHVCAAFTRLTSQHKTRC